MYKARNTRPKPTKIKRKNVMNAKKIASLNVSAGCKRLLKDLTRTRNSRAVAFLVRKGLAQRDSLLGKDEVDECDFDLTKIKESKSRARLADMLERVEALEERKDLSVFCSAAIAQRKAVRKARA
jgi:hypothetical protein